MKSRYLSIMGTLPSKKLFSVYLDVSPNYCTKSLSRIFLCREKISWRVISLRLEQQKLKVICIRLAFVNYLISCIVVLKSQTGCLVSENMLYLQYIGSHLCRVCLLLYTQLYLRLAKGQLGRSQIFFPALIFMSSSKQTKIAH